MDKAYKDLYKEVQKLRFKIQDMLDDHAHQLGQSLKRDIQRLEDEMEMSKNPRVLEDRIKGIQRTLVAVGENDQVMDHHHSDMLHDIFEDMRMKLRRFPNY